MDTQWYYVENKERKGPVGEAELRKLIGSGALDDQSFVWKKGFENWKKIADVSELKSMSPKVPDFESSLPPRLVLDPENLDESEKVISIKIGHDRGAASEVEYGPFSLIEMKRLWQEKRVSPKTFYFIPGMDNWLLLVDAPFFSQISGGMPPAIEEKDRRIHSRKPFVARILLHNNKEAFEGVCKDVSLGGLQILVYGAPCKMNEKVLLNVHPDNSDFCFTAEGKVVRVLEGDTGFSLEFTNLKEESKRAIRNYLESSST